MRKLISLVSLSLLASLVAGAIWLSQSESGLQSVAQIASQASGGRLLIEQSSGRLSGPLRIEHLAWTSPGIKISVDGLRLDWQPGALLHGQLAISELSADLLRLDIAGSNQASPPPSDLRLPVAVNIEKVAISQFDWSGIFRANGISGQLSSDGAEHRLSNFIAQSGNLALSGNASLGGSAPLPLNFTAQLSGQLDEKPLQLALNGDGPLERITVHGKALQGINGAGTATITPFAQQIFAKADLQITDLNPAAWHPGAPQAKLILLVDLQPTGEHIAGDFSITNQQAGPLDRQRLPLVQLSGKLATQGEQMNFERLNAQLSGGGTLNGKGRWQNNQLSLDLQAANLDAAGLLSRLRATRLNGPLAATLSIDQQAIQTTLNDQRFALKIDARHAASKVTVPILELSAGNSQLKASGELSLDQNMPFKLAGELSHFDPSRFLKAPAALINSRFTGAGKLAPRPQVDAKFTITDSRLAGEILAGQGEINIAWPNVPRAEISLKLGANQLKASGAYGRPGNLLEILIDAPQLGAYGIDGGLNAQLRLAGTPQAPTISAHAESPRLRTPGGAQLNNLKLKLAAGGTANAPLNLELGIARIDSAEQTGLARALQVQVNGSNSQHTLLANSELGEKQKLALRLHGGLDGLRWRGEVQEARLSGGRQNVQLSAPAALTLAPENWAFGPATLAGSDQVKNWQASVQASADAKSLRANLNARGPRLGELSGQLEAGMLGAWALNQQAPWLLGFKSDIEDLSWLAELLGEKWTSGGSLHGALKVSGSPALPVASGQFRGENLILRLPDQALHLTRGELDIELSNNLLRVKRLSFDSVLQNLPKALLRSEKLDVAALTKTPGKLEISGEMQVDRNKGADRAFLDIKLDRLGAYQLPDQWVVVSGDGRLNWENDTLGIRGKLAADAGYWQLAKAGTPTLSDDVVIKLKAGEKPSSNLRPKLELDLSTDLGKNFLFNGAGLSSRLTGDIRLRASGRDLPRASGSIRTRDGRFEAYGQQLSIERGILTFQGLLDNPALDVRAVRKGLAVEAGVQVSGTAQKPTVKLTSDPELPDAEKLAWLILGHGPEQMSASDATLLLSAAGSILGNDSGGVVKQLKNTFGFDEFGVRQGQIGDSGSRSQGSRVAGGSVDTTAATGNQILSVGKRLSSNALLSYEQTLGKAESVVKLTVNLSRQISVIGRAGSDNALDIFYTITLGRGSSELRPDKN